MDPYQFLGISHGCSRDELKNAFRARARSLHPDRGGDPADFIALRTSYEQVLLEIQRKPPPPVATSRPRPTDFIASSHAGADGVPEIVFLDEIRRIGRRDPRWVPDLILLDDPPSGSRTGHASGRQFRHEQDLAWFDQLAVHSHYSVPLSRTPWFMAVGMTTLIFVVLLMIWLCWAVWSDNPRTDGFEVVRWPSIQ